MSERSAINDNAETRMYRRNPADQAFDRWLQESLQRRHAAPADEPVPDELIALAMQAASRQPE